ncbi:hypothetical protein Bca101_009783 [Brassica carinata]
MEAQLSQMRQMMMQLVDKAQVNERTVQQLADRQQRFEEVTRSLTATTRPPPRQDPGVTFQIGEQGPVFQTPRARTAPAFNPPITGAMGSNVSSTSSVPNQATDRSTRLPPPPPIFRFGEGTSIPSGGRTSASGYQTRNFTPSLDEHQRTNADPTVHPTDPAHQNNPRDNERLSPPTAWENDRTRFRQEPAHQLEVRISDLERDLGKTASSLLKVKKEKNSKYSEFRRLQRKIQTHEEMDAHGSSEVADARDDFFGRLTRMAILFESLIAVRKRDLALAGIEGSLSELELLRGNEAPSLDSEQARLSYCKGEWATSEGDFDLILADLQAE